MLGVLLVTVTGYGLQIKSVANLARRDVREFFELAAEMHLSPEVQR